MSEPVVDRSWAAARVGRCTATAAAIEHALAHLTNVVAAMEGDDELVSQSRMLAALLRSRRDDLMSEARRLDVGPEAPA